MSWALIRQASVVFTIAATCEAAVGFQRLFPVHAQTANSTLQHDATAAERRIAFLNALPRHQTPIAMKTYGRLAASSSAPHYMIASLNLPFSALAVASNQVGQVLVRKAGIFGENYVAFTDALQPPIPLSGKCPPACDPLGGGPYYTSQFIATALNNRGQVVGEWVDHNQLRDGSTYTNGYFAQWQVYKNRNATLTQVLPRPVASPAVVAGGSSINDSGVAVGGGHGGAAEFYRRVITNFVPPRGFTISSTSVNAISNSGAVVGQAMGNFGPRAVAFNLASPSVLLPVHSPSSATATNINGDVVGTSQIGNNGPVTFLLTQHGTKYLPAPPPRQGCAEQYQPVAVNDADQVVGDTFYFCQQLVQQTSFLYSSGKTYDLVDLLPANANWQIVDVAGIDDRGEIVGNGYYKGTLEPFVMKLK